MTTAAPTQEAIVPAPEVARPGLSRRVIALIVVAVLAISGGAAWFITHRGLEETDDAQIEAEIVGVPARANGIVAKVLVAENQQVKAGDVLAALDDSTAKAKLAQAQAALEAAEATAEAADADAAVAATNASGNRDVAEASARTASASAVTAQDQIREAEASVKAAEASMKQAEVERDRTSSLVQSGALAKAVSDQTETAYSVAQASYEAAKARLSTLRSGVTQAKSRIAEANAKVKQTSDVNAVVAQANARAKAARAQVGTAKAAVDLAKIELNNTLILAPQDGTVSKKSISVGQAVGAGQPVAQLVTPAVWVTANFKEDQIAKMHPGQSVELSVDAFGGAKLHGEIESLAGATGSRFSLLPPDNATGNFTKVVQRLPVRIRVTQTPAGVELRPGLSVEASVNTRS